MTYEEYCLWGGDEFEEHTRTATESEAHAEWHRNAGIPMGTPGCPWDACHVDYPDFPANVDLTLEDAISMYEGFGIETIWCGDPNPGFVTVPPLDDDDLPF